MFKFVHVWGFGFRGKLGGVLIGKMKRRSERGYMERARKKIGSGGGVETGSWQKVAQKKISLGCLQPLERVCYNRAYIWT